MPTEFKLVIDDCKREKHLLSKNWKRITLHSFIIYLLKLKVKLSKLHERD